MLLVGTWLHEKQELSKWLNSVRQSFSFIRLSVLRWSEKRPPIVMYKWKWNWRIRTAAHVLDGKNGNIKFWGIGIEASALPNQSQLKCHNFTQWPINWTALTQRLEKMSLMFAISLLIKDACLLSCSSVFSRSNSDLLVLNFSDVPQGLQ